MPLNVFKKYAKGYSEYIYKNFEKDSGSMLLITSAIAVSVSSLAQAAAALMNKKYTLSQKAFMVPQELTEGVISVLSLIMISLPVQVFAKKYARTGKIITKEMQPYMEKYDLMKRRGDIDFDFKKFVNKEIAKIKGSDKFKRSKAPEQEEMLKEHLDIIQIYDANQDATSAISTAMAGVFTTSLVLPYIRNLSASYYQKLNIQQYKRFKDKNSKLYNYNTNNTQSGPMKI